MTSEIEHIFSFWDKKGNCWSKNEIDGTENYFFWDKKILRMGQIINF